MTGFVDFDTDAFRKYLPTCFNVSMTEGGDGPFLERRGKFSFWRTPRMPEQRGLNPSPGHACENTKQ